MRDHGTPERSKTPAAPRSDRTVLAATAAMVLAVACCAGGPAFVAVLGGVALGTVAGWAAGVVPCLAGAGALVFVHAGDATARRPQPRSRRRDELAPL